ncbi:uncharacterized protein BO80DRAFT_230662 [Aspergillus ibericus CBS 121593]|uniref:Uncharacterized protein n=1 Tax=Aspergillus ibericus CBS 121593 TaxID=1448316 RepID=A0A395GNB4_9EURO|nr:hypothetical protein BO80DRAFT_230662 [Aspergillus ibericus CBS 121593]RAK96327.1 hypothetical protein BO80DRAFT_230662 [Aspergillus ibericus CBS 121593]
MATIKIAMRTPPPSLEFLAAYRVQPSVSLSRIPIVFIIVITPVIQSCISALRGANRTYILRHVRCDGSRPCIHTSAGLSSDHLCKARCNGCTVASYQDYEVQSSLFIGEIQGCQIASVCCMSITNQGGSIRS